MNTKNKFLFFMLVAVMLTTQVAPAPVQVSAAQGPSLRGYTVETISAEFRRLDPFVTFKGEYQVLDVAGAR